MRRTISAKQNAKDNKQRTIAPWWISFCFRLRRLQCYIWGTVIIGLIKNLASTFLTTKGFDLIGTPLEWLITHPLFLGTSLLLVLGQTALAIWGNKQRTGTLHSPCSSSVLLEQRDSDIIQAIGKVGQAQPGPQLPTVADILPLLQNRYSEQNIIDTLEYFHERGDIRLLKVFGDPLN
jgi:hypothetical protein